MLYLLIQLIQLKLLINLLSNISVMKKVCPMDGISKREDMKQYIVELTKKIPMIRANLFGAIQRNLEDWKMRQ